MWTGKSLLGDIVRRQLTCIGHVLRKDELKKLVVTGFVDGKLDFKEATSPIQNTIDSNIRKILLILN